MHASARKEGHETPEPSSSRTDKPERADRLRSGGVSMRLVLASLLVDVITVISVPGVSAAFLSAAAATWAFLTRRGAAIAAEWAVRGLAAGFVLGLPLAVFLALDLAQAS
jgi:hypothetical protein